MVYSASKSRYDGMIYRRCGKSGVKLPIISLGLWHNFGFVDDYENARKMICGAFDLGITHFDLANNYGPPGGSAEVTFGRVLNQNLSAYRDELFISTKAGYYMWPGPYGEWGSKKYLVASLDQSLKRMGLDYVDVFYSHRPDPDTPLDETMAALDFIVRSGRALYVGISNYDPDHTIEAARILKALGTACLIHQPYYNMLGRWIEDGLTGALRNNGIGCIAFSPLAQGLLTDKYLVGVPDGSRASKAHGFLRPKDITDEKITKVKKLSEIAKRRGQNMAQMAIAWVLRLPEMTSALIGASKLEQLTDGIAAMKNLNFTPDELAEIDAILAM